MTVAILDMVIEMIDYASIGRRIAMYRKKRSMTQAALSERLGVSESYVSQVERGSAKVSLPRLAEIAELLDVDIALLVSDQAVVSPQPINTEIFEIIQEWPTERISLLVELLLCANEKIADLDKRGSGSPP